MNILVVLALGIRTTDLISISVLGWIYGTAFQNMKLFGLHSVKLLEPVLEMHIDAVSQNTCLRSIMSSFVITGVLPKWLKYDVLIKLFSQEWISVMWQVIVAGFNTEPIMESRGPNWNEQWLQYQRSDHRVRDEQYRSNHSGKQGHYPPPDVRESERQWHAPDPRYMYYMRGPPHAEISTAYNSQAYTPERARSHSRLVQWYVLTVCNVAKLLGALYLIAVFFFYFFFFIIAHFILGHYAAIHLLALLHL